MSVHLTVGDRDLTELAGGVQWSSVDPGGFEACSFTLPDDVAQQLTPGTDVTIWDGLTRAWMGRVEEPGDDFDINAAASQITAVGAGAVLKDKLLSMVWVDRDLSRWQGPSVQRQINVIGANFTPYAPTATPDATTGNPSLETGFDDTWTSTTRPDVEAWYDAGPANLIGQLRADWTRGTNVVNTDVNWVWAAILSSDDIETATDSTGSLRAAGPGTAAISAAGSRRFALLQFDYQAGPAGTAGMHYSIYWSNVRVFGNHGLTIRGSTSATEGIAGSDIAAYIAALAGLDTGVIEDCSSSYIVPHAAYYTPVTYEQHVDDMARLLGWHWGVWEPLSSFDTTARLDFRSPPSAPTATVRRADCQQLKLSQRLSEWHDVAKVTFTDAAGTMGETTVTVPNPRLPAGLSRELLLDAGTSTATIAAALGQDTLLLEQAQTRAAGSTQLPAMVQTARGWMAAHLLKPGIDRLKIAGLPGAGPVTDANEARLDSFRITRLTAQRGADGAIRTTVELDRGANLLDTLQARLAAAGAAAGI